MRKLRQNQHIVGAGIACRNVFKAISMSGFEFPATYYNFVEDYKLQDPVVLFDVAYQTLGTKFRTFSIDFRNARRSPRSSVSAVFSEFSGLPDARNARNPFSAERSTSNTRGPACDKRN